MTDTTPSADAQRTAVHVINGHRYIKPSVRVAVVTVDGVSCVVRAEELMDVLSDGAEYTVQLKEMTKKKFDALEEFKGW